ncbi:MAG TPA: nicotinamide-nucleotide amidase [Rhodocyclaceae bacterium]|jgi:nicotinamide-nucleotide amidase|nr:nicotinamide-nucleotide amidase [Rhodocyclaceae bacterium]
MTDPELEVLARSCGEALKRRGLVLASAESCTGGWVAAAITTIAGSSEWFDRGFVTYSNQAKQDMLGVTPGTLERFGAVSEQTAREMVEGALAHSRADVALAITGIAGPGGGSPAKPVGTVCFAWAIAGQETRTATRHFAGDRTAVRRQSVEFALRTLLDVIR